MTSVAFHIDQVFFPVPGGIGTYVRSLAPALARRDPSLDVRLFHSRFDPAADAEPEPWTTAFRTEELSGSVRSLYPRWDLAARPALPPALQECDVVHATNHVAIPPARSGQKLVVTVHDLAFEHYPSMFPRVWRYLYRAGLRAAIKRADAILTPSRNTAEDLLSRTDVAPEKLYVTPLAASLTRGTAEPAEVLARLKVPTPYVLFVGTLEPRKNLVRLVRAYRRVAATGVPHTLVLAGAMGWHPDALLREIALRGPGEIVLTGTLADEDLDAVYRGAAAFAYPSIYEGFGLPVIEAMARGIPTVASTSSAVPEAAGDAAIGVNPRSVRDIAKSLQRVLTDPELAEHLSSRARQHAERFSWDETARLTLQVYERVTETK